MSGEKNINSGKIWDTVVLIPQNNLHSTKNAESVRRFSYKKNLVFVTAGVACFAILSLAILLSLLFYSGSHEHSSESLTNSAKDIALSNSNNNDSQQQSNVSLGGLYILERLGSDFRGYLKSLKLPKQVADIVLKSAEVVEIVEPLEAEEEWKIITTADYGTHELRFQLGMPFDIPLGHFSSTSICELTRKTELRCTVKTSRNTITSTMTFTEKGFTETKVNNGKAKGTKNFLRVEQDGATAEEYLGHDYNDDDYEDILDDYLDELWDK